MFSVAANTRHGLELAYWAELGANGDNDGNEHQLATLRTIHIWALAEKPRTLSSRCSRLVLAVRIWTPPVKGPVHFFEFS